MTSVTDNRTTELRKLLDERGIEYAESQDRFRTRFRFNYCEACGDYLNEIEVMGACITASKSYLTPYQAIAATLGSGTCEVESKIFIEGEYVPCAYYEYEMECGGQFRWDDVEPPNHCPNCGAKVVG